MQPDYLIIGGGVVGLSVAYGLLRIGRRVLVFDGGDGSYRASRTNFGLVWVQSKGLKAPDYARWTRRSAAEWKPFAEELGRSSGVDLALRQEGGYDLHLNEAALDARIGEYEVLKAELGGDYPFEVLGHNALKREEPNIGPKVVGAILHREDGHVNPLRLLKALAGEVRRLGGDVRNGHEVVKVDPLGGGGFRVSLKSGERLSGEKIVLSAGLGAIELGPMLGFRVPIRPQRGQVLITEKLPHFMNLPSGLVRQVDEGGIQIGDSKEEVGFDDSVTLETTSEIAARAIKLFPALARTKLVRSWAGLRIMSPDGLPIYQKSQTCPGAFLVTCHSGITLAAVHARLLPFWLEGHPDAPNLEPFSEQRFTI
jgi:glycine/D-amino acid oxidase-like deaminating enzyme